MFEEIDVDQLKEKLPTLPEWAQEVICDLYEQIEFMKHKKHDGPVNTSIIFPPDNPFPIQRNVNVRFNVKHGNLSVRNDFGDGIKIFARDITKGYEMFLRAQSFAEFQVCFRKNHGYENNEGEWLIRNNIK